MRSFVIYQPFVLTTNFKTTVIHSFSQQQNTDEWANLLIH